MNAPIGVLTALAITAWAMGSSPILGRETYGTRWGYS